MKQILVIDDDFETCEFLTDIFSEEGWEVTARQTAEEASSAVAQSHFDLIVSDINLGGRINGVALLKEFKQISPASEVVLISGFGTLETAVAAVREGAFVAAAIAHVVVHHLHDRVLLRVGHSGECAGRHVGRLKLEGRLGFCCRAHAAR